MTKAVNEIVELALAQVGTKEGSNNWNPYAADPLMTQAYGMNMQNQPWCAIYVNWLFIHQFGLQVGKQMTYGCSASCYQQASLYKNAGAWSMNPRVGDQIFINVSGGINHTGIVVGLDGDWIVTVEGNWSDMVSEVWRKMSDGDIAGFGVPNWALASNEPIDEEPALLVDGECGENTWAALALRMPDFDKLPLLKRGAKGADVRFLQGMLDYLGANLDVDGDFGRKTEQAVRDFQGGKL